MSHLISAAFRLHDQLNAPVKNGYAAHTFHCSIESIGVSFFKSGRLH
jgi:hypothetical protein